MDLQSTYFEFGFHSERYRVLWKYFEQGKGRMEEKFGEYGYYAMREECNLDQNVSFIKGGNFFNPQLRMFCCFFFFKK